MSCEQVAAEIIMGWSYDAVTGGGFCKEDVEISALLNIFFL
jgi:hypothetical protein